MIRHAWECGKCAAVAQTVGTIESAPVAPHCCGVPMDKVWRPPTIMVRAGRPDYKPIVAGRGRLHGISADREMQLHKEQWSERAAAARSRARSLRGSKRSDEEMKPIASVPIQLFAARAKEFGSDYWTDDPLRAAKREGVDFGV